MADTEVKGESVQAPPSERLEEISAREADAIRSAYLARFATGEPSDVGAHEAAWESGAVRGAYLKHLAETTEVAAIGGTGVSEENLLRTVFTAHATAVAPPRTRRKPRKKARARRR